MQKGRLIVTAIPENGERSTHCHRCLEMGFLIGMTVLLIFLIWRCFFGFANVDECFYLTIPYRICQGDKFLVHEWHMSQLSGLLLVPLMRVFFIFSDGTDGIVIVFRLFLLSFGGLHLYSFIFGFGGFQYMAQLLLHFVSRFMFLME